MDRDSSPERALSAVELWEIGDGYGFSLGQDFTSPSKIRVLKLHGSTNWRGLIFGGTTGFGHADSSLGRRPVILPDAEFKYLGYSGLRDPACAAISRAASVNAMIMPVANKKFYYETSFGREWEPFWDDLWSQANQGLQESEEIVVIGYSLPPADARARELLFNHSNRSAFLTVCCGSDSDRIETELREHGITHFRNLSDRSFEGWLNSY